MELDGNGDGLIRRQWCHGAPGIVATLTPFMDEESAVAGGQLTWLAGPLRKGAGLCHGTAGNGYAFLALLERTGDERWLEPPRVAAATRSGRATSAPRSTSPTASTAAAGRRFPEASATPRTCPLRRG